MCKTGATSARVVEVDVTQTKGGKTPERLDNGTPSGAARHSMTRRSGGMNVTSQVKAACQRAHLGRSRRLTYEDKIIALFDMEYWVSDK
jgi:hypothetical protein